MKNQEKINAIIASQAIVVENNTEELISLNANIEVLLSQTAALIEEQQKLLNQNQTLYDEIQLVKEQNPPQEDHNSPEDIGNISTVMQNPLTESPELG